MTESKELTRAETSTLIRPLVNPADLIAHHREVTELISQALERDRDFGIIPGTKEPTLLKPGAERLAIAFGCSASYSVIEREIDHDRKVDWEKEKWDREARRRVKTTGTSIGLYRFVVRCDLLSRRTGESVGSGVGSASTMEGRYVDRPRELENTVLKMAQKRALVAAVLGSFGLSDRFTQDLEDRLPARGSKPPDTVCRRSGRPTAPPASPPGNGVTPIWAKAKEKGIAQDVFRGKVRELGITHEISTHTPEALKALETWVQVWVDPRKAEALQALRQAAKNWYPSEPELIDFAAVHFGYDDLASLEALTVTEVGELMTALDELAQGGGQEPPADVVLE